MSVEALVWRRGRLFAGGLDSQIIEFDTATLSHKVRTATCTSLLVLIATLKHAVDSHGGPVWALAANPELSVLAVRIAPCINRVPSHTRRQAGCEDGTVKLFSIDDGGLMYHKTLERQKGRVMALAWHGDGNLLASGTSERYHSVTLL